MSGPLLAELIVGRALFRILQRLVRLGDVLEFLFALRILRDIGMIFLRELAVCLLDGIGAGVALDAQNAVVVLVFHARIRVGCNASPDL